MKECALTSRALKVWNYQAKNALRKQTDKRFQNFVHLFETVQLSRLFEESSGRYWLQPSFPVSDRLPVLAEPVVVKGRNPRLPLPHPLLEVRLIEESLNNALQRGFIKSDFPSGLAGLQKLRENAQKIATEWASRGRQITDANAQGILALKGTQHSSLNEPALFYEEAEMNGRKILTPVLYLPSHLSDQKTTSTATIQSGGQLVLTGEQLIQMEGGSLRTEKDINVVGKQILFQGTRLKGQEIALQSSCDMGILPFQVVKKFGSGNSKGYVQLNFPAHLEGRNVDLTAKNRLIVQGAQIKADQNLTLQAEKGLALCSAPNVLHEERERVESGNWWSGDTTIREVRHRVIPQVSLLKAGNEISLTSDKEKLSLEAAKLTSQQGIDLKAPQGKIHIGPARDVTFFQSQGSSSGIICQTSHNEGYQHVRVVNTVLDPGAGEVTLMAGKGIEANLRNKLLQEDKPLQKALENRKDVTHHQIPEQHKSWNETHRALGGPVTALLAIGIACCTAGVGSSLGTALVGQMGLQSTTLGTMVAAGAKAGFSTMAAQGVIGTINHEGNILGTLKDMGSGQSLRSLSISMLTAGVARGLGEQTGLLQAERNLQAPLNLGHHVKQGLVQGVARIGVEGVLSRDEFSAILERSLREGLANTTGGFVSSHIGVLAKTDEIDGVSQKIAHAALGAAEAAIRGGNPAAGAIGAVVGEIVGEIYRDQKEQTGEFNPDREDFQEIVDKGVDIARFTAASAACLLGEDPDLAALTAANAARYNGLAKELFRKILAQKPGKIPQLPHRPAANKPGAAPGQPGANPNAAKPGTGQAGVPVKQGNPPAKSGTQEDFRPKHQLKQHQEKITDVPENRVAYEKYLAERRANLTREEAHSVHDPNLRKLMKDIYQETDKIGSGGTGNAVRHTKNTGEKIGDSTHLEKAQEYSKALEKWLKNNPSRLNTDTEKMQKIDITLGSSHDRQIAEQALNELRNSVGKDPMKF